MSDLGNALRSIFRPLEVSENMVVAVAHLDAITSEERCAALRLYCEHCGVKQPWHPNEMGFVGVCEPGCQCEKDE
jgi:hypothetical protein